jgi:hypothetical protein
MQNSRFSPAPVLLVSTLAAGMLAACGGGGSGDDNGAPPEPPPPPPPASFGPNFSEIQDEVFTPTCALSGCHTGAAAQEGLRLDEANSYGMLVDVASSQVPSILRVAPGDPDNSYLIQKLEVIRQWISDGAIDDRASSTGAISVTSLSPMPGSEMDTAPDRIIVMFDRELDVSTVNANTFILEASGGDATFADGNEAQITAAGISVSRTNAKSAIFDLRGVALANDTYRVRLLGSGPSMILDLDANALDGEFAGTTPAGDGTEGGDFEAEFTVAAAPGSRE